MKQILNILLWLSICLLTSSCGKEENESEVVSLTIHRQFDTAVMHGKLSDLNDFSDYEDRGLIVNSLDDLPEDEYFGNEDFIRAQIDFSRYSLILVYQFELGDIISYKYRWCYNNWFDRYQFMATFNRVKDSEYVDGEVENFSYIRSAIVVSHIPSDAKWSISEGVHDR